MIPYSTPLWTIFTKWPGARVAEVAPAVGRGEHVEDRREPLRRDSSWPPTIMQ